MKSIMYAFFAGLIWGGMASHSLTIQEKGELLAIAVICIVIAETVDRIDESIRR